MTMVAAVRNCLVDKYSAQWRHIAAFTRRWRACFEKVRPQRQAGRACAWRMHRGPPSPARVQQHVRYLSTAISTRSEFSRPTKWARLRQHSATVNGFRRCTWTYLAAANRSRSASSPEPGQAASPPAAACSFSNLPCLSFLANYPIISVEIRTFHRLLASQYALSDEFL